MSLNFLGLVEVNLNEIIEILKFRIFNNLNVLLYFPSFINTYV